MCTDEITDSHFPKQVKVLCRPAIRSCGFGYLAQLSCLKKAIDSLSLELDAFEIQAIDEGCTLEASAIAPNGMRLTDIPLLLIRSDPTTYVPETFGGPRRTDDYGTATWTFQLVPNTDFIYQVISPHPVGKTVGSNPMEIELCTGVRSENAFPQVRSPDVGRGCR